jgi:hypothetical protein
MRRVEYVTLKVGRDGAVGITIRYALDGAGFDGGTQTYHTRPSGLWGHPASYTLSARYFPGVKRPVRGVDNPLTSGAEVKDKVELYPYSPSGPTWTLPSCKAQKTPRSATQI